MSSSSLGLDGSSPLDYGTPISFGRDHQSTPTKAAMSRLTEAGVSFAGTQPGLCCCGLGQRLNRPING